VAQCQRASRLRRAVGRRGTESLLNQSAPRASLSAPIRFLVAIILRRGFSAAVPPPLVGEEDGHENDSGRDAEAHGETNPIAAEHAVHKQRHARACDDAVDEGDHACGSGQERDERAGPARRCRAPLRPSSTLGGEVHGGFRRKRTVVRANARDAPEELLIRYPREGARLCRVSLWPRWRQMLGARQRYCVAILEKAKVLAGRSGRTGLRRTD